MSAFRDYIMKMTYYKSNPEWVWYDENEMPHLTDKAPPEAVESYNFAMERLKKQQEDGILYN